MAATELGSAICQRIYSLRGECRLHWSYSAASMNVCCRAIGVVLWRSDSENIRLGGEAERGRTEGRRSQEGKAEFGWSERQSR